MPEMEAAGLVLSFRWKPERLRKLGLRLVSRASIADRMLGAVVSRPRSVGMAEVPRRAGKDEPAAAGAPHLPAGDEGGEPLPQRSVCAVVAALRRAPTTTGALELLDMAARARPAQGDDLPVPTNTGGRCHLVVVLPGGGMIVVGGDMRTSWVAPPVAGFGDAERRTSSAAGILTVCRAPPNGAERAAVDHPVDGREVDAEGGRHLPRRQERQQRFLMHSHLCHKPMLFAGPRLPLLSICQCRRQPLRPAQGRHLIGSAAGAWAANADALACADVLVQELDLEALLLRLELDDVPDRDDANHPALVVDDR